MFVAAGSTVALFQLDIQGLTFCAPVVGLLAFLLLDRPYRELPEGPVTASGRSWGWSWVRVGDTTAWLGPGEAAEPRSRAVEVPVEPSHTGFELQLTDSAPPRPVVRAALLNGLVHLTLPIWLVGALLLALALKGELSPVGLNADDLVLFVILMVAWESMIGLVVAGWGGLAILGSFLWSRATAASSERIRVDGAMLTAGGQTFYLGQPGQQLALGWNARGAVLELRNVAQRIVLRGRHDQLAWLARRLETAAIEGDERDVPDAIRRALSEPVRSAAEGRAAARSPDRPPR